MLSNTTTNTTSKSADAATSSTVIGVSNVRKRFGSHDVLRGIDLTIERGEIVLVMGPNGAGKSVLLSCLSGSLEPDDGRVRLFDGLTPADARSETSVMVQGAMADPDLTGRENLRFYEDLHPNGTDQWRDLVEVLEIEDDLDRVVGDYSGGMRRKIELAVTLSADVPFYVLDEPTIELDLATIRALHDLLLERRAAGKTILVTSHAPLDAQIADRIAFLRDGRFIADDSPSALLERLPPVVRVRGAIPPESKLVGERLFQRGDEVRGFLAPGVDIADLESELEATADAPLVDVDRPSYTDLFNYYTYLADE